METTETTRREAEIDTALAEAHGRMDKIQRDLESLRINMHQTLDIRAEYPWRGSRRSKTAVYPHTLTEVAELLRENLASENLASYNREARLAKLAKYQELTTQALATRDEIDKLNEAYTGWSRFFLVNNAGGHIHSSMHCSTCHPTTSFSWLPTLSGLTEKDAVDAHGAILCTVCFPSAPVEWTVGHEKPVDPDRCPGSGTWDHDSSGLRYYSPRARCNHCHQTTSVTSTGKLRAHKRPQ